MTWTYAFDEAPALDRAALKALLGGKGANLAVMTNELALPVPPGFVITTEACKAFGRAGWPSGLDAELRAQMARIGERVGRAFGDPRDPLLVSVRSGAPVSMPGMLDTILNLGLNPATTEGLAVVSGDPAFASGCRQPPRVDVLRHRRRGQRPRRSVATAARLRSRPSSAPGTVPVREPTVSERASRLTWARRSWCRPWSSAIGVPRLRDRRPVHPQPGHWREAALRRRPLRGAG